MAGRSVPTEESLGLSPTEDELTTSVQVEDPDIPINDDEPPALSVAKPGDAKTPAQSDDEPPADPAKQPEPAKPEDPKMVDVRAVQEARAEARETKRQMALLEQRVNDILMARQAPPQPEPEAPAIPDLNDPQAVLEWARTELLAQKERETQQEQQREQQTAEEQVYQQAFAQVDADFRATAQADPTLNEALNALRESQGNELLAMGYSIPEAKAILAKNEREHVVFVAQRGLNIADHVKSLAMARGWRPGAAQQQQQAAPAKTDLAAVAAAQQRHQSLSDAPGGETIAPLDAKALAKMTDKEFKAWMSKKGNEAKFDEMMGR